MKQTFTQKCGFMLLVMLFAFIQGTWAQGTKKVNVKFSTKEFTTEVGGSITQPTLEITEEGSTTPIRSRFKYTYSIVQLTPKSDGTFEEKDIDFDGQTKVNGKYAVVDPTTGSSVQYRYGAVVIGGKSGTFKVKVKVSPTVRWEDTYSDTYATYTVTVKSVSPTLTVTTGQRTLTTDDNAVALYSKVEGFNDWSGNHQGKLRYKWKPIANERPSYTIRYGKTDYSGYYKVSYSISPESTYELSYTNNSEGESVLSGYQVKETTTDEATITYPQGTLTITATPTEEGKKTVGDAVLSFNITLNGKGLGTSSENKVKTYISFSKHEMKHYRFTNRSDDNSINGPVSSDYTYTDMLVPTIVDENGNDVTYLYNLNYGSYDKEGHLNKSFIYGQDVFYKYSDEPWDSYDQWTYSTHTNNAYMSAWEQTAIPTVMVASLTAGSYPDAWGAPDDYIITSTPELKQWNLPNPSDYDKIKIYENTPELRKNSEGKENEYTVKGMFYGKEKDANGVSQKNTNVYTLKDNQFVFHLYKHSPQLLFTPDPKTVVIANNFKMKPENRFHVKGYFKDETMPSLKTDSMFYNSSLGYRKFSYCVFVPDANRWTDDDAAKLKADENYVPDVVKIEINENDASYYERTKAYCYTSFDDKGNPVGDPVLTEGERFYTKENWGNDKLNVIFHGKGYVPMYYNIVPYTPTHWDVGSQQAIVYNIADAEPTHLVITPKEIVTTTGVTSQAPEVRVYTDLGEDVTKYFTLTPTKKSEDNITLGTEEKPSDPKNLKYAVTSDKEGTYTITVSAEPTKDNTHFSKPNSDTYDVIVKSSKEGSLFEVIYDDKEFNTTSDGSNGLNDHIDADGKITVNASKMGKLHFIKTGTFYPGTTSFGQVPGLNIKFGTADETKAGKSYEVIVPTKWTDGTSLKDNENDKVNATDNTKLDRDYLFFDETVVPDGTDLPIVGFIELDPTTNGFLTIDVMFHKNELWILRDMETNEDQQLSSATDYSGEMRYSMPLLADHKYALWSDQMSGFFHGLSFDPAFISLKTDHAGWHNAVTFQNGYTGALPKLRSNKNSKITYSLRDIEGDPKNTNVPTGKTVVTIDKGKSGYHASVNSETGQVSAYHLTTDKTLYNGKSQGTTSTGAEMDNRVLVLASVLGERKADGKQVEKRPHYNLYIGNMPTYIVEDGANFDQGLRVSTNNIPTRIWMTIGGWTHIQDELYPYQKNDSKGNMLADGWKTAKMDSVGRDNMTIDNFNFNSFGEQNPLNEDIQSWNSFRLAKPWNVKDVSATNSTQTLDKQLTTFNVPVRGTYLKFEPEESGRLFLYIIQNGMTDISKGDATSSDPKKVKDWSDVNLRRRALYIVDETGNNVYIPDGNAGWANQDLDQYVPTGQTSAQRFPGYVAPNLNYYCDGITRVGWADKEDAEKGYQALKIVTEPGAKNSWVSDYDHTGNGSNMKLTAEGQKNLDADINTITKWWKDNPNEYSPSGERKATWEHSKLGGPNEVLKLSDGGYVLPTKGYVRYTFNVKAGKTYYVFMTGSKLGFCGFGFLPQGYEHDAKPWLDYADESNLLDDRSAFNEDVYKKLPKVDAVYSDNTHIYDGTNYGSTITLDASATADKDNSYANQIKKIITSSNTNKDREFVNVNLKRKFLYKRWHGICLPFSVSEKQVKEVFGQNVQVITFDSIRADKHGLSNDGTTREDQSRTVHFTRHVTQLLEAGRPYFIYPDDGTSAEGTVLTYKDESGKTENGVQFKHVTFEDKPTKTVIGYNEKVINYNNAVTDHKDYINIFTYKVVGIYDESEIPFYSYYMNIGKDASGSGSGENGLMRVIPASETAKEAKLPGYNAYLYPYSSDAAGNDKLDETTVNAKAADFWISGGEVNGGEVTAIDQLIEDLNEEQTNFVKGVYTIDGVKVSSINSLEGLAPGVYIMDGKKYTVK